MFLRCAKGREPVMPFVVRKVTGRSWPLPYGSEGAGPVCHGVSGENSAGTQA